MRPARSMSASAPVTPKDSCVFRSMGPSGVNWEGGRTSDTAAFMVNYPLRIDRLPPIAQGVSPLPFGLTRATAGRSLRHSRGSDLAKFVSLGPVAEARTARQAGCARPR